MMTAATIEQEISATNRAFEQAFAKGDAAGLAAVYTSDGQALPPNAKTLSDKQSIQQLWQGFIDLGVKGVRLKTLELEQHGDTAYEVGQGEILGEGDVVLDVAKFIVIWKKENGQWKWHRDIWNSNNPA
jgi:ketosteroid isomerase-like protein